MLVAQIPVPEALPDTFRAVDLCGVLLNGVLGGLIARRKNYDLVGFVVLAILTATAGGILRDVMIQAGPPFALTDPYYLYTACAGALIAWWVPFRSTPARRLLVVADAVVLGTWSATGASKALANGLGVMPALLLGCLTAVGGSMIRDVSVGETPAVFGGNKLYAVPALCAAGTAVGVVRGGLPEAYALLAGDTSVGKSKKRPFKRYTERELITLESEIGAELFGPVEKGRHREFFCLDEKTWIWHEEWTDERRHIQTNTIRYEITDQGILKAQEGARYSYLTGNELRNFVMATRLYYERVAREIYRVDPNTGQRFADPD